MRKLNFFKTLWLVLRHREKIFFDHLTGFFVRSLFYPLIEKEIKRAERYQTPFSLCFVDIDNLKKINDQEGHSQGDKVIKEIARFIEEHCRQSDYLCRYGGDEFLILLPQTDKTGLENFIKKLERESKKIPYSFSVGGATFQKGKSIEELIKEADKKMYFSKNSKKNQ